MANLPSVAYKIIMKFFEPKIYKGLNAALMVVVLSIVLYIGYYYESGLCLERCTYEFRNGLLNPLDIASKSLLMTLTLFLLLPAHYFRRWLWYIASWAIPVSLFIVSVASVPPADIFSGRTFLANITMDALFVLSIVFVFGVFMYNHIQSTKKKNLPLN